MYTRQKWTASVYSKFGQGKGWYHSLDSGQARWGVWVLHVVHKRAIRKVSNWLRPCCCFQHGPRRRVHALGKRHQHLHCQVPKPIVRLSQLCATPSIYGVVYIMQSRCNWKCDCIPMLRGSDESWTSKRQYYAKQPKAVTMQQTFGAIWQPPFPQDVCCAYHLQACSLQARYISRNDQLKSFFFLNSTLIHFISPMYDKYDSVTCRSRSQVTCFQDERSN